MAKVGDLLELEDFIGTDGQLVSLHYFLVIDEIPGIVENLDYDFIAIIDGSVKNKNHMEYLKASETDILLGKSDIISHIFFYKKSFLRLSNLYFFKGDLIKYKRIGKLAIPKIKETLSKISELIDNEKIDVNINNLDPQAFQRLQDSNLDSTDGTFKQ